MWKDTDQFDTTFTFLYGNVNPLIPEYIQNGGKNNYYFSFKMMWN